MKSQSSTCHLLTKYCLILLAMTTSIVMVATPAKADNTRNTLLLFGDSIVQGGYGNNVIPLIDSKYPDIKHKNKGVGGTALTDITYPPKFHRDKNGICRYAKDVIKQKPRIFVMQYGTNDNYFWNLHGKPDEGLVKFEETYRKVIGEIKSALPNTLIILQTIAPTNNPKRLFEDWAAATNTNIFNIAMDQGLIVADMSRQIDHDFSGFPDGVHPNLEGKKRMAEILAKAILQSKPLSQSDWSFSFKGPMEHKIQGYCFRAPDIKFDTKGKFGDFVDVENVTHKGLTVKTNTPVHIQTPPIFKPSSQIQIKIGPIGLPVSLEINSDEQGSITLTTPAADCEILFEDVPATLPIADTLPNADALPANVGNVSLKVTDIKGSYTIPYIQSSDTLSVHVSFTDPTVVTAEVCVSIDAKQMGDIIVATPAAPFVTLGPLSPGEYSLMIVGKDASGKAISNDIYTPIGIGTVIAALGDSITEGYYSQGFWQDDLDLTAQMFLADVVSKDGRNYPQYTPTTVRHQPETNCFTSWMTRLNDLLAEKWNYPVFIANEGVGGISTARYLAMMKNDKGWQERMHLLKPTVWLIHLGVNDERAKIDASVVVANLNAMVDILIKDYQAHPSKIVIATPSYDYASGASEYLSAYCVEIAKIIEKRDLHKGPDFFLAYSKDKQRYYGNNPVHPNLEGMTLMAELWADAIPNNH
ncbi:MAG: SGNH/GDSL hydrolase family protein [Phycisphaeraceae bacterium]|nr:SGNH/GDSL hydrolase family protein [Phycisphaeraceae bacterium]